VNDEKGTPKKKAVKLSHGLYARDVLLPWDDSEQFDALHSGLKEELFPIGLSEEECVLDLALLYWQKRTLWRLRTAAVLHDRFTNEILATEKKSWVGIRNSLRASAREEQSVLNSLEKAVADAVSGLSKTARNLAKDPNALDAEKLGPILEMGVRLVRDSMQPLLDEARELPTAERAFDKNHTPEALEKVVRLEMSIDVRIGKVMSRLVALKEFKRTPAGSRLGQLVAPRPLGAPK
jgi:hypothetical protein